MRILFIRHGEPDYAKDDLTDTGVRQAELLAQRLKDEDIDEIWASPLGRAQRTAQISSEVLSIPVKTLECLREIKWGSINGEPVFADGHPWDIADEMAHLGMDLTSSDWQTNQFYINNTAVESVKRVESGIDEWLSSFGYIRQGLYYDHAAEEDNHKTVALFCHGGSSSAAIAHMVNLQFPYVCAMLHMDFTGITIVRFDKKAGKCTLPCLELANNARHIF
ncbi:MAG: histidine phosphatase family protein [Lachnospiraceae bacterium]|nr:histidine phosphatase family protein [Lachnospiraceae bacterium]